MTATVPAFVINLARAHVKGQALLYGSWTTNGAIAALVHRCGIVHEDAVAGIAAVKADASWMNAYRGTCADRA